MVVEQRRTVHIAIVSAGGLFEFSDETVNNFLSDHKHCAKERWHTPQTTGLVSEGRAGELFSTCQTICHLYQHQCSCQLSNNGSIKCILSYHILSQ